MGAWSASQTINCKQQFDVIMVASEVDRAAIHEPCQHQLTQSLDNNAPQRAAVGLRQLTLPISLQPGSCFRFGEGANRSRRVNIIRQFNRVRILCNKGWRTSIPPCFTAQ